MTPPQPRAMLLLAPHGRKPYRVGTLRRVQAGRIRVVAVQTLRLRDITHDQARLLGHRGTAPFKRDWLARFDQAWLTDERGDDEQLDRFAARWGQRDAELVTYVHVEPPELLADVRGGHGDYTTSPSRTIDREAGCVDEAVLAQYAKMARQKSLATRETFQADLERERAIQKAEKRPYPRRAA